MKKVILFCVAIACQFLMHADSPLTSTYFAIAYRDVPDIERIVARYEVMESGGVALDDACLRFLDGDASMDQKMALINALGWGSPTNTSIYCAHLIKKYGVDQLLLDSLTNFNEADMAFDSQICERASLRGIKDQDMLALAYMQVMGDYFQPLKGVNIIDYLFQKQPQNESVAIVACLIAGQYLMDLDWCGVYHAMDLVYIEPRTEHKFRDRAKEVIQEYFNLYKVACDEMNALYDTSAYEIVQEMPIITGDARIFSLDEFGATPVYAKSSTTQKWSKDAYADLVLLTKKGEDEMALYNWLRYDDLFEGTSIDLVIKNDGNIASNETNLLVRIFSAGEGDKESYFQDKIPSIPAGATHRMTVTISGYWIYDPDAHFSIELDFDNNIEEKNEKNNVLEIFEQG